MIRYVIPVRAVSVANLREHWAARYRRARQHRQAAYLLTPSRVGLPAVVTLTRVGKRQLDDDNSVCSLKSCRDGIAQRLGVDDADPRVTWRYAQRRGYDCVEVLIEPRD